MPPFTISHDHSSHDPGESALQARVLEDNLLHVRHFDWPTDAVLDSGDYSEWIGSSLSSRMSEKDATITFPLKDSLVDLQISNGHMMAHVFSPTLDQVKEVVEVIQEKVPHAAPGKEEETSITFWSRSPQGPQSIRRRIVTPAWEEIQENYAEAVRDELGPFIVAKDGEWSSNGQLLLWQGEPGTGKTYALRALARGWRKWCDFHYITDPEKFFGPDSDYMLSVILSSSSSSPYDLDMDDEGGPQDKWKLLILEDCGEMLASDAKQNVGQALSRLLNVVDGLIGQGLRLLILVTTNEELRKLHPAVSRYGRCSLQLAFEDLAPEEVEAWAEAHGVEPPKGSHNVSELYGLLAGKKTKEKVVGFA